MSSVLCASLRSTTAFSIASFFSAGILSPYSTICFSVWNTNESAALSFSTLSLANLSESALASASAFILAISSSERPVDASIRIDCSLLVPLSFADTLKIPLASISNVTSI